MDADTVQKLRERFSHLHPLIVQRSVDRARTAVELFDILDSVPAQYPLLWDDADRRWVTTDDILQTRSFR